LQFFPVKHLLLYKICHFLEIFRLFLKKLSSRLIYF